MKLHLTEPKSASWIDVSVALVGPKSLLHKWHGSTEPHYTRLLQAIGADYLAVCRANGCEVLLIGDTPAAYTVLKGELQEGSKRGPALVICKWLGAELGAVLPASIMLDRSAALQTVALDGNNDESYAMIDLDGRTDLSVHAFLSFAFPEGKIMASYYESQINPSSIFGFVVLEKAVPKSHEPTSQP